MGRGRKKKLLIITILLVAVTSLSIGLATFSNVLTISSSATVKPGDGEYKLTIYGFTVNPFSITNITSMNDFFAYMSESISVPVFENATASNATIDNNNFKINNISATFTDPDRGAIVYYFTILNEGAYDVYINLATLEDVYNGRVSKVCTAAEGTSQILVDESCESINLSGTFGVTSISNGGKLYISSFINPSLKSYKISPGKHVLIMLGMGIRDSITADGEFSVEFEDISIEFSATDMYAS